MNKDKVFHFTVGELIEILQSFPPETPGLTSGYENGFENIQQPILQDMVHKPGNPYYDGEFQPANERDREIIRPVILRRAVRES
jgi:hypothetical protein